MFSFQGRADRGSYAFTVFTSFVLLGLVGGGYYYIMLLGGVTSLSQMYFAAAVAVASFCTLVGLLLFIAGTVRRYHDRGKSGAWAFLIPTGIGIPVVLAEGLLMKGTEGQNAFDVLQVQPVKAEAKQETKPEEIKESAKPEDLKKAETTGKKEEAKVQAVPKAEAVKEETKTETIITPVAPAVSAVLSTASVKTETQASVPSGTQATKMPAEKPIASAVAKAPIAETKLEVKPEIKQDIKIEAKSETAKETSQEIKQEIKPEIKIDTKSETIKEVSPEIQPKTTAAPGATPAALDGAAIPQTGDKAGIPYTIPPVRSMTEMLAELERLSKEAPVKKAEAPIKEATKPPVTKEAIEGVASIQPKIEEIAPTLDTAPKAELPKIKFGPDADIASVPSSESTEDLTKNLNSLMEDAKGALDELPVQASANSTPGTISFGPKS